MSGRATDPQQRYPVQALWCSLTYCGLFRLALSFWGPYVHLLGGFTNLAPVYAFVIGVLLHFHAMRAPRYRFTTATAICAAIVMVICGLKKQTSPIILLECLNSGALIFLIASQQAGTLLSPSIWPLFVSTDGFPIAFTYFIRSGSLLHLEQSALLD